MNMMKKMKKITRWFAVYMVFCLSMAAVPVTALANVKENAYTIKNITITDATISYQAGDAPKATAVISDSEAHYEIAYESWLRMEKQDEYTWQSAASWYSDPGALSDLQKLTTFEMGKYYWYNIELNAKDGYTFPSESELNMSLNGKQISPGSVCVADDGSKLSMIGIAELGSKKPIIDIADVDDVFFGYRAGDVPRASAILPDPEARCEIAYEYWEEMETKPDGASEPAAYWYSDENKNNALSADKKITAFEEGKTYMYSIVLKAKALCSFSQSSSVMVNGSKVNAVNITNSGTGLFVAAVKTIRITSGSEQKDVCTNGHKIQKNITKASEKNDGKIVTGCSVCKKVLSTEMIPKVSEIRLSAVSYTYNGKVKKPSVMVKDRTGKKISTADYTVSYAGGRKNVGSYDVTITFRGNYQGKAVKPFIIRPQNVSINKVKSGKKKILVKWKKQNRQISGFEIQYATDRKFKKGKKTVTSAARAASKTITKVKMKKKYYVRIRSYKTVRINGKTQKIYSSWSKGKSVKVKR